MSGISWRHTVKGVESMRRVKQPRRRRTSSSDTNPTVVSGDSATTAVTTTPTSQVLRDANESATESNNNNPETATKTPRAEPTSAEIITTQYDLNEGIFVQVATFYVLVLAFGYSNRLTTGVSMLLAAAVLFGLKALLQPRR